MLSPQGPGQDRPSTGLLGGLGLFLASRCLLNLGCQSCKRLLTFLPILEPSVERRPVNVHRITDCRHTIARCQQTAYLLPQFRRQLCRSAYIGHRRRHTPRAWVPRGIISPCSSHGRVYCPFALRTWWFCIVATGCMISRTPFNTHNSHDFPSFSALLARVVAVYGRPGRFYGVFFLVNVCYTALRDRSATRSTPNATPTTAHIVLSAAPL